MPEHLELGRHSRETSCTLTARSAKGETVKAPHNTALNVTSVLIADAIASLAKVLGAMSDQ